MKEFLKDLVACPSPSGYEERCMEIFKKYCSEFATPFFEDKIGNVVYSIGTGYKRILLSGHIDELGLQVIGIGKDGKLSVIPLGGVDKKVLPGSKVLVETENQNWVVGVIGKKPIHAETPDDRNSVSKLSDLTVDLGYSSDEDIKKLGVEIGSFIVYDRNLGDLDFGDGKQILAPGLDDKLGVLVAAEIGKRLASDSKFLSDYQILIAATVQEEVGLRGATVLGQLLKPDISIDFDVTPSSDYGVNTKEWGDLSVGKGPVIEIGPDKNKRLVRLLKETAKNHEIPYQITVTGRPGGTNTDVIQLFGGNCETAHLALAIKNLHTPVEICSWDDVENSVKLVVELVKTGKL